MTKDVRLPAAVVDALVVATVVCLAWSIAASLDTRAVLDTDVVNLAFAIDRFDLAAHQPHPPGYLGYVVVLRAVHTVTGLAALDAVKLTARLFAAIAIVMVYLSGRAAAPDRRGVARLAVALAATNPLLLYYAVDGQTHAAECAVAAALVWLLVSDRHADAGRGYARAVAVGALLAVGGSFRPSLALIAVVPVLWWYRRRWLHLGVIAAVGAAGTAAWLVPTVVLTGGWHAYRVASDALIGPFARATSVLSGDRDSRMVADNLRSLAIWGGAALAPALVALPIARWRDATRATYWLLALMAAPALAFYGAVFIAEAGYVLGLLPPACLAAGCALGLDTRAWSRVAGAALVAAQLGAFFAAPGAPAGAQWWFPSVSEITFLQDSAEVFVDRVSAGEPPDARLLVVSDHGPPSLFRQLPVLRPNTHVLQVNSARIALFEHTTLSLATEDDWLSVPGPALLVDGPPSTLSIAADYDAVVIGPTYTPELAAEIAAQTTCPVPPPSPRLVAPHLPVATCFPSRTLRFSPHRFRWGAPETTLLRDP